MYLSLRMVHGGGGGIRTHVSQKARGVSKPVQWTSYVTPPGSRILTKNSFEFNDSDWKNYLD